MPMKNPSHPGDFIRTEIIEPVGLSVTAAAVASPALCDYRSTPRLIPPFYHTHRGEHLCRKGFLRS